MPSKQRLLEFPFQNALPHLSIQRHLEITAPISGIQGVVYNTAPFPPRGMSTEVHTRGCTPSNPHQKVPPSNPHQKVCPSNPHERSVQCSPHQVSPLQPTPEGVSPPTHTRGVSVAVHTRGCVHSNPHQKVCPLQRVKHKYISGDPPPNDYKKNDEYSWRMNEAIAQPSILNRQPESAA